METRPTFHVYADRNGKLFVAGSDWHPSETDARLAGPFATGDEAFDWAEDMQHRVNAHCAACG